MASRHICHERVLSLWICCQCLKIRLFHMNIQISSSLEKLEYCLHCVYIPAWQNLVGAQWSPFPLVR